MTNEFNFIHESRPESDKDPYFGPLDPNDPNDAFIHFTDAWTMADILVAAGIFQSKTQARKNGFDKPIKQGWSDFRQGKKKIRICILNRWNGSK